MRLPTALCRLNYHFPLIPKYEVLRQVRADKKKKIERLTENKGKISDTEQEVASPCSLPWSCTVSAHQKAAHSLLLSIRCIQMIVNLHLLKCKCKMYVCFPV